MNMTISGHHLEVTPALHDYVTAKLARIARHFDQVVDAKVLLSIDKTTEKEKSQKAECRLYVKGNDLFAESTKHDMYASIDDLVDKLDRQVNKYKEKHQKSHNHATAKREMTAME